MLKVSDVIFLGLSMKGNPRHKAWQGWNSSSFSWEQVLSTTYSPDTYFRFWHSSLGYVGLGLAASRLSKSVLDITDSVWGPSPLTGQGFQPIMAVHWSRPFPRFSMSWSGSSCSYTSSSLYATGSSTLSMLTSSPYSRISSSLQVDTNMIPLRSWPHNMISIFLPIKATASFTWVLCLRSQLDQGSRDLQQHSPM